MQLHVARLCLDCEELHVANACPRCSSQSFALLSKWVPAPERRAQPRPPGRDDDPDTYRKLLNPETNDDRSRRWLKRGVLLAAVSAGGWLWQRNANRKQPTTLPPAPPQS